MSIVRTDVPMTAQLCDETILELTRKYPFCRSELLTTTAFERPVRSLVIGNGERRVLYAAAFHANEWITAPVILKFVEDLAEAIQNGTQIGGVDGAGLAQQVTIYTVPMVNPDGVDLVTGVLQPGQVAYEAAVAISQEFPNIPFPDGWKANLLGVDLNLQFPAGWLQAREIKYSQGYDRPAPRD